jgi:hypothetical protein
VEGSWKPEDYGEFIYSARYFTTNNKSSAFYVGSFLGYQKIEGAESKQFPIGVGLGYRGGLRGYFGEIYGRLGYSIGGGQTVSADHGEGYGKSETSSLYLSIGVAFLGFGWDW